MAIKIFSLKPHVVFRDKDHSYFRTHDWFKYLSVTTLIGKYKNPFDSHFWLIYKAGQMLIPNFGELKEKYLFTDKPKLQEEILKVVSEEDLENIRFLLTDIWRQKSKKATDKGTDGHNFREQESIRLGYKVNPMQKKKYPTRHGYKKPGYNSSVKSNLIDLVDGYYPELVVWDDRLGVAGQSDSIFIETLAGIRFVDVGDYKTNKTALQKSSYQNPVTMQYAMMLEPLTHIMDVEWWHYCLQLSLYAYVLERAGYVVRSVYMEYIPTTSYKRLYPMQYLREDIIRMLKHYLIVKPSVATA